MYYYTDCHGTGEIIPYIITKKHIVVVKRDGKLSYPLGEALPLYTGLYFLYYPYNIDDV